MALHWSPPVATSKQEDQILARCKKAKLFVFLRQHRHELFDDDFQRELAGMYPSVRAARMRIPVNVNAKIGPS